MERCLDLCDSAGVTLVKLDSTREGRLLYSSLGFQDEYPLGMSKVTEDAIRPPPRREFRESEIRRAEPKDLASIVSLDTSACGMNREELIHRLLRDYSGWGFISETEQPSGFSIC